MAALKFKGEILITGVNPYVRVSAARVKKIRPDWKKPIPVLGRINGEPEKPWRINMMPMGNGDYYLYLHGEVRKASQTKVGDEVNVEVEFDAKYRNGPMHKMPAWFAAALKNDRTAKANWVRFTPSRKKEVLRYFAGLKSKEAQQRNLEKMMNALGGKKTRFMGRDWN